MNGHDIPPERQAALIALRDELKGESGKRQSFRLLTGIQRLQHVSTFEASRFLDIYHPPARKRDLVKAGYPIVTIWRDVVTEAGRRHRVGVYFLAREVPDA